MPLAWFRGVYGAPSVLALSGYGVRLVRGLLVRLGVLYLPRLLGSLGAVYGL
jgi:hypothetical protein